MIYSREELITWMFRMVRITAQSPIINSDPFDFFSAESANFVNPGRKLWAPDV
jgi:hypothetical protein